MVDYGFRRDIANGRLDVEVAGTDLIQMTATALTLPVATTVSAILTALAGLTLSGPTTIADTATVTGNLDITGAFKVNAGAAGFIPLDICSLRIISSDNIAAETDASGGLISLDTDPILKRVNAATDKAIRVDWDGTSVLEAQFPGVPLPQNMNTALDFTIHALTAVEGSTSATLSLDFQVFAGHTDTEMGGAMSIDSSTTDINESSITITAANTPALPSFLNISLIPAAHTTGADLYLYAAWIEYAIG